MGLYLFMSSGNYCLGEAVVIQIILKKIMLMNVHNLITNTLRSYNKLHNTVIEIVSHVVFRFEQVKIT